MHDTPAWHAYRALFEHPVIFEHLVRGFVRGLATDDGADLRDRLDWRRLRPVNADDMPGPAYPHSVFWSIDLQDPGAAGPVLFMVEIHTGIDAGAAGRLAACHAALSAADGPVPRLVQVVIHDGDVPWSPEAAEPGAPEQLVLDLRAWETPDFDVTSLLSTIFAIQMTRMPDHAAVSLPQACLRMIPQPEHAGTVDAILEWGNQLAREHGLELGITRKLGEPDRTRQDTKHLADLRLPYYREGITRGQRDGYEKALREQGASERVLMWRMAQVKFGRQQVAGMPRLMDQHFPMEDQDRVALIGGMIITSSTAKQLAKRMRRGR